MPPDDAELQRLAGKVAAGLRQRGWRLAAAESCTGGWIGKLLTDLPGSSAWFEASLVTYSNATKSRLLKVDPALIESRGAVSQKVALAMAAGALRKTSADIALAVTGIAGPDGGSADKPVGTVWFAWALKDGQRSSAHEVLPGDRDAVRRQTVATALQGVLDLLSRD